MIYVLIKILQELQHEKYLCLNYAEQKNQNRSTVELIV